MSATDRDGLLIWTRRLVRAVLGIAVTCGLSVLWFVGLVLATWTPSSRRRWRGFLFRSWARSMFSILGMHLDVRGTLPRGPGFLVTNHTSPADVWALGATVDVTLVSMEELVRWPILGFMARQFGTIFIRRTKKREIPAVNLEIEQALARGELIAFFPEGRSSDGRGLAPFRPSLFQPAVDRDQPVHWATIRYETQAPDLPASASVCWGGLSLATLAKRMLGLRRVRVELDFGSAPERGTDRKDLARRVEALVRAAYRPMA